jgi:hypothetical protein
MTAYQRVLEIARQQALAASVGDLTTAATLLEERRALIAAAPPALAADHEVIRAILDLDRDIATAFRRRMIAIRDEVVATRHGQQALAGYARVLDRTG